MPQHNELQQIYDRIWAGARNKALENAMASDLPPEIGETRWGVSLILRVPFLPSIAALAEELTATAGPVHLCYDTSNFHMTLRSIEGYRGDVPGDDAAASLYAARSAEVLPLLRGLSIELRGLTCGNSSALVQGWPDGNLQDFRLALHRALEDIEIAVPSGETAPDRVRNTAHASLLLMNGDLADPRGFAEIIDRHRETAFGSFKPEAAELVYYRRTDADILVERLELLPIG